MSLASVYCPALPTQRSLISRALTQRVHRNTASHSNTLRRPQPQLSSGASVGQRIQAGRPLHLGPTYPDAANLQGFCEDDSVLSVRHRPISASVYQLSSNFSDARHALVEPPPKISWFAKMYHEVGMEVVRVRKPNSSFTNLLPRRHDLAGFQALGPTLKREAKGQAVGWGYSAVIGLNPGNEVPE